MPHLFGSTAFQELPVPVADAVWLAERSIPWVHRGVPFQAISESTAEDLVARGIPRELVRVTYCGIDSAHFTPLAGTRSPVPLFAYPNGRPGEDYGPEHVLVSPGAKACLFFATQALSDVDDEVLVPTPYWVTYPEQVRLAGARPVFVECDEERGCWNRQWRGALADGLR